MDRWERNCSIFYPHEFQKNQLKGYAAIAGLLTIYSPLISMSHNDFTELCQKNRLTSHPVETRLFHKIPAKHKQTYARALSQYYPIITTQQQIEERYHRARLIIDYISSMTDSFAIEEYRQLQAIE